MVTTRLRRRIPPARSNFGRRNTSTPPNPACAFNCRPFGATQCRAQLQCQELGNLGDLGLKYPPDPPRTSWRRTAGSDPDPGRLKQPQDPGRSLEVIPPVGRQRRHQGPGLSRMIPPAGRWRRLQIPVGDWQSQGRSLKDTTDACDLGPLHHDWHGCFRSACGLSRKRLPAKKSRNIFYPPNTSFSSGHAPTLPSAVTVFGRLLQAMVRCVRSVAEYRCSPRRGTSMSLRLPQDTINALAHGGGGTITLPDERLDTRTQHRAR